MKMIAGGWYEFKKRNTTKVYYLKYKNEHNGHSYASEYIIKENNRYYNDEGSLNKEYFDIKRVHIKKIKKYLPEGHADLRRLNINN